MVQPGRRTIIAAIVVALLLTSCANRATPALSTATAGPTELPTAQPSATVPAASVAPSPTTIVATETVAVATLEATAVAPATPAPAAPSATAGTIVLQLSAGAGDEQVGIEQSGDTLVGPNAFRIGSDGSIRILDRLKKRVLFFESAGSLSRVLQLSEAQQPQDFIVNNAGQTFVFDQGAQQVLQYSLKGNLINRYPLDPSVSAAADSIMLNAAQDLVLMQQNRSFWLVLFKGAPVPPDQQAASKHDGAITPRSPTIFRTSTAEDNTLSQEIFPLQSLSDDPIDSVDTRAVQVPADAQFFNIDRAMNMYYTRTDSSQSTVAIWRVLPDGTTAGGVQISNSGCTSNWRSLYVDQVGAAWSMCVSATGVQLTRYPMLATDGTVLADADKAAANVPWRPGARLDAA